jgi:two-component system sensor histidine kinase KdpD
LLQTISEQSDRMSRMIDDLLDLSRLTAGALEPAADWIDPRELAEAAIEESASGGDESRVTLEVGHDLPLVRGDEPQLKRVLVNLIENALKFSPAGSAVTVSIAEMPETVDTAVADAGPGIPADELTTIFEPFYRSDAHAGVPGSGLGLAVAMGLAVANGCTLTVTSEPGAGSRFVLGVPRDPGEAA